MPENPWPRPAWLKKLDRLVAAMDIYQHKNNHVDVSYSLEDIQFKRILPSDWPRTFQPINQEREICETWGLL